MIVDFLFLSRLSKELEHIALVDLDARLVEGVDVEKIGRESAGTEEEIHEVSEIIGIHLPD